MLIYAGKKISRVGVGRVAWFCPICRDIAAHGLVSVRKQTHLYGVGLGRGQDLHDETTCEQCGLFQVLKAGEFAGASPGGKDATLDELIEVGRPNLMEELAPRLEVEANLDTLEPEDRAELISEVFASVNSMYEFRAKNPKSDGWSILLLLVVIGSGFAGGVLHTSPIPHPIWPWLFVISGVSFVGLVWRSVVTRPPSAKSVYGPLLAKALEPLNPSAEELEAGMEMLNPRLRKALKK